MLPSGALPVFPHCPSSVCSRRSATYISSLPQQCSLQQELSPPAPPLPSQLPNPPPLSLPPPTTALSLSPSQQPHAIIGIPPPSCFLHCRSNASSSRNLLYISPLLQQCLLQQEPSLYFPTAPAGALYVFPTTAVVSAPAGALSIFSHCRSSACSRRSLLYFSPLPQQCLLPQERYLYFLTAAAVSAPAGALSIFPHCRSSARSRRSLPSTSPLPQQYPLPQELHQYLPTAAGRGEYPGLGNYYRARSPLLGQHAKYAYRLFSSLLSKCELVKWCFINKFREEHARIINTANSSSVITSLIQ